MTRTLISSAVSCIHRRTLQEKEAAHGFQEPANERLVLPLLAEENQLNLAAHNSQPRAMISESLSPASPVASLSRRVMMLPELSRFSRTPDSPPR